MLLHKAPWILANYAGISRDGNSGATTLAIRYGFEQVEIFNSDMPEAISNGVNGNNNIVVGATGKYAVQFDMNATPAGTNKTYKVYAFEVAAAGKTLTSTSQANPIVVAATAHGFSDGDKVKLAGISTATSLNNRIFTVAGKTDDAFNLTEDNGGNVNGSGLGVGSGGTAYLTTQLTVIHNERKFATQDVGALTGGGIVSLTKDNLLEMFINNITDATDITIESCSFYLHRLA